MKIRVIHGPGSRWEGTAVVDQAGIVIDGKGYCPLDDLRGILIVEVARHAVRISARLFASFQ